MALIEGRHIQHRPVADFPLPLHFNSINDAVFDELKYMKEVFKRLSI